MGAALKFDELTLRIDLNVENPLGEAYSIARLPHVQKNPRPLTLEMV